VLHDSLVVKSLDVIVFGARFHCDLGDDWPPTGTNSRYVRRRIT
jgi:hypothetical protein